MLVSSLLFDKKTSSERLPSDNALSRVVAKDNGYTRYYAAELLEHQDPSNVDALSGATSSGTNFKKLTTAVIEQAIAGNPNTRIVETEE